MSASLLELRGITKRFAGVLALHEVELTLRAGQILAVMGENGAGKSTLMKILSGAHRPDAGVIRLDGAEVVLGDPERAQALGIGIVYQEFSLVPSLNAVDNLFLGRERTRLGIRARKVMEQEAAAVLGRLGATVPLRVPVANLSVAEQQFIEIGKALLRRTRILIMDEPTATLTPPETARLFGVMRDLAKEGVSIIFISHHLGEVFELADDILCLRDGRTVREMPTRDCTSAEVIRAMVGRDVTQIYPPKAAAANDAATILLEVRNLQRKPHLPENSFNLHAGEILGIAGLVGSGRTKLIRALIGADSAHRREIRLGGRPLCIRNPADARIAGIGLAPEDRKQQGLVLRASIKDNVVLTNLRTLCHPVGRFLRQGAATEATQILMTKLGVKARTVHQPTENLSGGNQQKVVLAKWLHADCEILILDEPTRGIDVGAKAEIYQLMRTLTQQGIGIIMISSELPEVIGMSDRIMVMRQQRIVRTFDWGAKVTPEAIMTIAAGGAEHE